ncbi:AAA family ATPase [Ornithinimicrobium sp. Y1847]|uniref:AAA family ATPase n=1 Tax=unclassified Ornithinimicrobium TaxID=2615080 RepID=UPI003B67927D
MSALEQRGREHGCYFTAAELVATTFPEPRWAVPGLIAEGLNLLVGSPKLGKSWLVLGLGVAIASGGRALGKVPVEKGSVLYAALEDTPRRLKGRLKAVLADEPVPDDLHITTLLPRGQDMIELVSDWLDAHPDARLVVIDVLRKVTPRTDGRNAYEADYDAMTALKRLADKHGVAVIAVHHTRKMADETDVFNEVSGSTGLTGAADAILIAKRARNTAEAVLHVTGRDVTEHEYGLTWHADSCTWALLDEPVAIASMGTTRRKVLSWLTDHEGDTPTQISEATGISLTTVKQTVRRMVDDHQLDTDGQGHYFPPTQSLSPVSPVSPMQVNGSPAGDTPVTALSPALTSNGDSGDSGDTQPLLTLVTEEIRP